MKPNQLKPSQYTKNVHLRLVEPTDALFIFNLRSDQNKNTHLSTSAPTVEEQEAWLIQYKNREQQGLEYYYIISNSRNEKLGVVRLYDFKDNSFCWGSWIISSNAPNYAAIESALTIYYIAFHYLGFSKSHFDVRRKNTKVIKFHQRLGAKIISEDISNYYFNFSLEAYQKMQYRYKKYIKK